MSGGAGNFFAIDARVWSRVCAAGLNPAVAYLVQAAFSGRDNSTTSASINAVETYTRISRRRAGEAIERLIAEGLETRVDGARPTYKLSAFPERGAQARKQAITENAIWLPNELVTGAAGEKPPVELVRQTQDVMVLRLLIDLYGAQHLREDGGVDRRLTRRKFKRTTVGESAQWIVYGFEEERDYVILQGFAAAHARVLSTAERAMGEIDEGVDFFARMETLQTLGLVEYVPHLLESEDASAEVVQPYGIGFTDGIEDQLGIAAHELGMALLSPAQAQWACRKEWHLAAVPRHLSHVAMVGVARTRYRPRTRLTCRWVADLEREGAVNLTRFKEALTRRLQRAAS